MNIRRSALLGAPAALVLVLVSSGVADRGAEKEALKAFHGRIEALRQDWRSRSHHRQPVLLPGAGLAVEGRAWEYYDEMYAGLAKIDELHMLGAAARKACELPRAERAKEAARLMEALRPQLGALRHGARCLDATPPFDPAPNAITDPQRLGRTMPITDIACLVGLAAMEAGDALGGAQWILDSMQLSHDLTRSPLLIDQMVGVSGYLPGPLRLYGEQHGFQGLGQVGLAHLDEGIDAFLSNLRSDPDPSGDLMQFEAVAGSVGSSVDGDFARLALHAMVMLDEVQALGPWPAAECLVRWDQEEAESNPVLASFAVPLQSCIESYRYNVVRLGQLHHALRLARGLEPQLLVDPFGEPCHSTREGDDCALWVSHPGAGGDNIQLRFQASR